MFDHKILDKFIKADLFYFFFPNKALLLGTNLIGAQTQGRSAVAVLLVCSPRGQGILCCCFLRTWHTVGGQ